MIKFLQTTRVDANIADSVSICFLFVKGADLRHFESFWSHKAMKITSVLI